MDHNNKKKILMSSHKTKGKRTRKRNKEKIVYGYKEAQTVKNPQCRRCRRHRFNPWVWKIPRRREWLPTPAFLPGESHGQRNLVGYSPWGLREIWTRLSDWAYMCTSLCSICLSVYSESSLPSVPSSHHFLKHTILFPPSDSWAVYWASDPTL